MLNTYYGPDTPSCAFLLLLEHFKSPFLTLKIGPSVWAVLHESQIYPGSTSRDITS